MIKYVCIYSEPYNGHNGYPPALTTDKVYDGVEDFLCIKIIDDKGDINKYRKDRFILLSEWREQKINEILHD